MQRLSVLDGHPAATLAFTVILAGATVIAALAASESLASVLRRTIVLGSGTGTAPLTLAIILAGTGILVGLAATRALAGILSLADMQVALLGRVRAITV